MEKIYMNRIDITPNSRNVHYDVDSKRRTVTCTITNTDVMLRKFMGFACFGHNSMHIDDLIQMPPKFVGTAKCDPRDEWNEEVGKLIAFSRAKYKCQSSFFKHARAVIDAMDKQLDFYVKQLNKYGDAVGRRLEKRTSILHEMTGEYIKIGEY